jgi:hypothetical protein
MKYLKCLLDMLFGGIGVLVDPLIIITSFVWQISGGIIRFAVSLLVFLLKIVTRSPFINFWTFIPDALGLFGAFIAIFTQPVVLGAKDLRNVTVPDSYVNPLTQMQREKYAMLAYELFGTNFDGCIENPIPCLCARMNLTDACTTDPDSLTLAQVMTLVAVHFEGVTECDSLVNEEAQQSPALWNDVAYATRFLYIDCVAKRVQGDKYAKMAGDAFPADFFYSRDGWYKLFMATQYTLRHHFAKETRAEREFYRQTNNGTEFTQYYKGLESRAQIVRNKLLTMDKIDENSPAVNFIIRADNAWTKYKDGYYHILVRRGWVNLKRGYLPLGTWHDIIGDMRGGVNEIGGAFRYLHQNLGDIQRSTADGFDAVGRMVRDIVYNRAKNVGNFHKDKSVPETPYLIKRFNPGRIFRETQITKTFHRTISHIWKHLRAIDISFNSLPWRAGVYWTPEKTKNVESVKRLFAGVFHAIWPHYTTEDTYKRFILNGNCRVVDEAVRVGAELVDYCLRDLEGNLPPNATRSVYLRKTAGIRPGTFHNRFKGSLRYEMQHGRMRPRVYNPLAKQAQRPTFNRQIYRRAMHTPGEPFNLFTWVIDLIEDILDTNWLQEGSNAISDIKDWFLNSNLDPAQWPDVGFAYWSTRFLLRCDFPENVNCSIGIGLEAAIKRVTVVFLLVMIFASIFFPPILAILTFISGVVLWFFIVMAVAFHWSPACLILWPTWSISPEVSSPMIPVPMGPSLLPECLMDEAVALLDKYITTDYSFIVNETMINGPVSPTCDEFIDVINCGQAGISDGVQTLLYWGYRAFGDTFNRIAVAFANTFIVKIFFPSLGPYVLETLTVFKNASPTEIEQLKRCAIIALPTVALIVLIALPIALFFLTVVSALIDFLWSVWLLIRSTYGYSAVAEEYNEYDIVPGEDAEPEPFEEDEQVEAQIQQAFARRRPEGWINRAARVVKNNFIIGYRGTKRKKE